MSNERENDELLLNIDQMLLEFSHAPSNPSIYRVADCLRSTNSKAYEPMIISIGPYHHGKSHLKDMQKLKKRYLKQLLGDSRVDKYVHAIRAKEQAARDCYAEAIELGSDEFVHMLLLDGIFIIEFLLKYDKVNKREEESFDGLVSGFGHVVSLILRDLMLFENQIPLLVIDLLFDLVKNNDQDMFSDLIWPFLSTTQEMPLDIKGDHLLGLVHYVRTLSFSDTFSSDNDSSVKMENIHSASELKEAGVIFKKAKNNKTNSWLDIKFKNKTLYFPEFEISDVTESLLKNMIAYEYYLPSSYRRYVTDYAFFLHCLVHCTKDAELLRRYGVISNWLGGDARVFEVIDRLGTNAQPSDKFSYSGVFLSMNRHCRLRGNRWIAVLRRNHFNNPWTAISLVAAVVLLSVGIVQMVFAILSYYKEGQRD